MVEEGGHVKPVTLCIRGRKGRFGRIFATLDCFYYEIYNPRYDSEAASTGLGFERNQLVPVALHPAGKRKLQQSNLDGTRR
jgi:hypothetical protein